MIGDPAVWADLAATIAIEAPIVAALAWRLDLGVRRAILASVAVNLLTQPLFGLVLATFAGARWWAWFAGGEAAVVAVEAGLYLALLPAARRATWTALALSLAANLVSAGVGLLLPF